MKIFCPTCFLVIGLRFFSVIIERKNVTKPMKTCSSPQSIVLSISRSSFCGSRELQPMAVGSLHKLCLRRREGNKANNKKENQWWVLEKNIRWKNKKKKVWNNLDIIWELFLANLCKCCYNSEFLISILQFLLSQINALGLCQAKCHGKVLECLQSYARTRMLCM